MKTDWIRCTKRFLCPICEHDHYCAVTADGQLVHCMHLPSSKPCQSPKVGGWFHRLSDPVPPRPEPKPKVKPVPVEDFPALNAKYVDQLKQADKIAEGYGVSERSLERLDAGWNGNITFPMRNEFYQIIGIRVCGPKGKWCVTGSGVGVFWPASIDGPEPILFPEGPSDCAACLTLGFPAIGRPNDRGGVDVLFALLSRRPRDVVIVSDNDEAKIQPDGSERFPGIEGAESLAEKLRPVAKTIKIIQPIRYKDSRQWLKEGGATHDIVQTVINNTGYFV